MTAAGCPEDLLVLERRQSLSPSERRALAEHASRCELCRMSIAIGRTLAPLPPTGACDELQAVRIATRALAAASAGERGDGVEPMVAAGHPGAGAHAAGTVTWRGHAGRVAMRQGVLRRARRWAVAAAVLLTAGSASAALWRLASPGHGWPWSRTSSRIAPTGHPGRSPAQRLHAVAAPAPATPQGPSLLAPPMDPLPETPSTVPSKVAAAAEGDGQAAAAERRQASEAPHAPGGTPLDGRPRAPSVAVPGARPLPSRAAPARQGAPARSATPLAHPPSTATSAAELFRDANRARRARRVPDAVRLYLTLQATFPGSAEARLSFLSLGDLYFSRHEYLAALGQFDGYAGSGESVLIEEALVGRARALAALGRARDERAAWQTLLARCPQSDYRWRAQQRLAELDSSAP